MARRVNYIACTDAYTNRYSAILILLLLVMTGCKKNNTPGQETPIPVCLKTVSPEGANFDPANITFKWNNTCHSSDTFKIICYSTIRDPYIPTDTFVWISTVSTSMNANHALYYGTFYTWYVQCGNNISDTAVFNTIYPDSSYTGKYLVQVSYSSIIQDTLLGTTTITVTQQSPGLLRFADDSIMHQSFNVQYNTLYAAGYGYGFYGYPPDRFITFPTGNINVFNGTHYASGPVGYNWVGRKVQ